MEVIGFDSARGLYSHSSQFIGRSEAFSPIIDFGFFSLSQHKRVDLSNMLGSLVVFSILAAIGVATLLHYVGKAPEGYQDRGGFRFGPRPVRDRNVVAVSGRGPIGANPSLGGRIAARQSQPSSHSSSLRSN